MPKLSPQCNTPTTARRIQAGYDRLDELRDKFAMEDAEAAAKAATRASETCLRIAKKMKVNCG